MRVKTYDMKYTSQAKQLTIDEFKSSLEGLSKSNRWVQLGDHLPWAKIEKIYNSADGLSYRLKVRLSTDFACLRDVTVISDKTIGEQLRLLEQVKDSITMAPK